MLVMQLKLYYKADFKRVRFWKKYRILIIYFFIIIMMSVMSIRMGTNVANWKILNIGKNYYK